jgi:hypothetical protein
MSYDNNNDDDPPRHDGRAFLQNEVDMISNALTLDWKPAHPTASDPREEIRIPADNVPVLLHELTHCQCFQTAVGTSFRTLWEIIVMGSKNASTISSLEQGEIPEAYLRIVKNFSAGLLLFQPWIEGLALFAQWDALPGESAAASKAMLTASALYFLSSRPRNLTEGYAEFSNVIKEGRASYRAGTAKTDLLSQPLADEKGGYLVGYLAVKALFKKAVTITDKFCDSDYFITFVCARLFHDPLMAAFLLSTHINEADWLELVTSRLLDRLSIFGSDAIGSAAEQYERYLELASRDHPSQIRDFDSDVANLAGDDANVLLKLISREGDPLQRMLNDSMGLSDEDWAMATQVEVYIRSIYTTENSGVPFERRLYVHQLGLRHRAMIRLRRVMGVAVVDTKRVIFKDGATGKAMAICDNSQNAKQGEYKDAIYTLYFDYGAQCLLRVAQTMDQHRGNLLGFEFYSFHGGKSNPENTRLLVDAIIAGERHEYNRSQPGGMDQIIEVIDVCLLEPEKRSIRELSYDVAFATVGTDAFQHNEDELIDLLKTDGIFGWLGKGQRVVESAVALSILASSGTRLTDIRKKMGSEDQDMDALLKELDDFEEKYGLQLYSIQKRGAEQHLILSF